MPKKNRKLALNSGIQTNQILTNDDEVCIQRLSSILLAVNNLFEKKKLYYLPYTQIIPLLTLILKFNTTSKKVTMLFVAVVTVIPVVWSFPRLTPSSLAWMARQDTLAHSYQRLRLFVNHGNKVGNLLLEYIINHYAIEIIFKSWGLFRIYQLISTANLALFE